MEIKGDYDEKTEYALTTLGSKVVLDENLVSSEGMEKNIRIAERNRNARLSIFKLRRTQSSKQIEATSIQKKVQVHEFND